MKTCKRWITYGIVTEGRTGGECGQLVYLDDLCLVHFEQEERSTKDFLETMSRATKHVPGVGIHGKGIMCSCKVFIEDGENHPWGLPGALEDAQRLAGLKPCLKCAYRWEHTELNITCDCEEGWVPR